MNFTFKIVASTQQGALEPTESYFQQVVSDASSAVSADELTMQAATDACTYLDSVDGGDIQMDKSLYRQCMAMVAEFLQTAASAEVSALVNKSWAGTTINELIKDARVRMAQKAGAAFSPLRKAA